MTKDRKFTWYVIIAVALLSAFLGNVTVAVLYVLLAWLWLAVWDRIFPSRR